MNTTEYERPGIVRHQMGGMNKFGQQLAPRLQTHIDGVAVADLVASTARRCSSSPRAR